MPKAKERYKAIKEALTKAEEATGVELTHTIYDVIKTADGKFAVVKLSYNADEQVAVVEKTEKVFDSASRADYNCSELNTGERVARLRNGNG